MANATFSPLEKIEKFENSAEYMGKLLHSLL